MPPLDQPKADPLNLLLDEIESLSAHTRLLELSLKRAHTDAFDEVEKFQQQFRAKVTSLKAEFEDRGANLSERRTVTREDGSPVDVQTQDLVRRFAEQQNLIQRSHEESERRGAAIVALREQLSRLEAVNQELQQGAALRVAEAQQELRSQVARLQAELAQKEQACEQMWAALRQTEQNAAATVRRLEEELASTHHAADRERAETERNEIASNEPRQRFEELESTREQPHGETQQQLEILRHDAQAKIAALQSEIGRQTALLTQNQSTIARLEQELNASYALWQSKASETQNLIENHAGEIARRDTVIAELQGAAQQQRRAAASELSEARETFAAEIAALRSQLREKQLLLEQRQGAQNAEQELRNRNRELQGRLAAKESVIESQEYHLRNAQSQLLAVRDTLAETERALAESQTRVAEEEQRSLAERNDWRSQLAESQLLVERYNCEMERAKHGLAAVLESQRHGLEEQSAVQERAQKLSAQVEALTAQVGENQATLGNRDQTLRRNEAQIAELSAALGASRIALEEQQARARSLEQDFSARLAELRLELERREQALSERDLIASRAEPEFKAQIADLQSQVQEKDRLLEARAREIDILQARMESLSGQAARLEAAQPQALADAAGEADRARQALQSQITALQSSSDRQQALLEEKQAALTRIEQKLVAEIAESKERWGGQQTLIEKQTTELRQAEEESKALRERMAQLASAGQETAEAAVRRAESDAARIAALEQQLESSKQTLAEGEAALRRSQEQLEKATGGVELTQNPSGSENQSDELRAAQDKIAELLDRLAQLEAARHTLQENAGHELQQLRESFESRIAKLRMELIAKEQSRAQDQPPVNNQTTMTGLEEGFRRQIQDLQSRLVEQHSLLESRNEDLIKVKAELDALKDYCAQLGTGARQAFTDEPSSVELREEDAVDTPPAFGNGSLKPASSQQSAAGLGANVGAEGDAQGRSAAVADNRFTYLEGGVRSWSPQPEKDSAFGSGRRWNIGLFKRRWKN